MNKLCLAFDVYGTLIDTQAVAAKISDYIGETKAKEFSLFWRNKQLEYSFRRGLMKQYVTFMQCTKEALIYSNDFFQKPLSDDQQNEILDLYASLPAFDDALIGLKKLQEKQIGLFAFSNGQSEAVKQLLTTAKLLDFFDDIISVDEIKTFKPNPVVYTHFLKRANSQMESTYLISSNPFDVIGALSTGMQAIWVKRNKTDIFDPWNIKPTHTIDTLLALEDIL